jgi:pimeloyl-ACP methyl ester carboxylesterase
MAAAATVGGVRSADGTSIAFERAGTGPALILVDGAGCFRGFGPMGPLAALLASEFTVLTYDRRGRGDSTDTLPVARLSAITTPTLVLASEDSDDRLRNWAQGVGDTLPNAWHRALKGEWHGVPAEDLAPVLAEFFTGRGSI